jgi:MFS family permease
LFELISQPPKDSQSFKDLIPKTILDILKTKYIVGVCFLLLVSAKLFAYYADVYKDIYVIVEYSKHLQADNLNLNSFGFQVFMLLIVSVTLPAIVNLFTLHYAKKWSNWQSRIFHFGLLILSPLVPALAVYASSKLNFVSQRIKTFHQNNKTLKSKNCSDSIKTLLKNDHLMQQSSTILSDLRANENATEHFIQSLVLIMLIALKFTKSGTVSGFQELLAGNSNSFFLILSAVWSVFSIISGFVQRKIAQKNHSMPFTGILIQLSYATLAMICRISACVIFFAPAMGLFNLLRHWKMGNLAFTNTIIYDAIDNGTLIKANDVWKQINHYKELTVSQLDVYYIVFLIIMLFHFCIVAAIKLKCSKEFKSRKDYLKKMLHILHQGNNSCTFYAEKMLKM